VVGRTLSRAPDASAAAVLDSVPRDPGRDVTTSGMPHCKNACSNGRAAQRTIRNNPVARSDATHNLHSQELGAGLRTTPTQQLTPLTLPRWRWLLAPYWRALVLVLLMCLLLEVTTLRRALLTPLAAAAAHAGVADAAALVRDAARARGR